jgi:hypothetical protein
MSSLDSILEAKADPTEIIDSLFKEKKWDLLISALQQRNLI